MLVYEQQFVEYLIAHPPADRPPGMVLMYPRPTIFTKHTIVPTDAAGAKVAQLLQTDDTLEKLEIRHGFRTSDAARTAAGWRQQGVILPSQVSDVVDPPSFEALETMIRAVGAGYDRQ